MPEFFDDPSHVWHLYVIRCKDRDALIKHLNNEVYHLGLEKSADYLVKKEAAAKTLLVLYKRNPNIKHDNDLLEWFSRLTKLKLTLLGKWFYKLFENIMRTQLTGSKPSILLLQLYRLSYLCFIARN